MHRHSFSRHSSVPSRWLRLWRRRWYTLLIVLAAGLALGRASASDLHTAPTGQATPPVPATPLHSNRLIIEFGSPSLAEIHARRQAGPTDGGQPGEDPGLLETYSLQLRNEHTAFVHNAVQAIPEIQNSQFLSLDEPASALTFEVLKNAVVMETPAGFSEQDRATLESLPNVKRVHKDYEVFPQLYTGPSLIQAETLWTGPADSLSHTGQGILIASIDAGIHKDAPMFDADSFAYPDWYPEAGLGHTEANNGKIIVSRTYFREKDPPLASDHFPWPGSASSHGVHTAAIAAGNPVADARFQGTALPALSGIAPDAWLGNYRVFYRSRSGRHTFFTAEGVAALEDTVQDGMDIVIGSWGVGPSITEAPLNFLDSALVNTAQAGLFVVMAGGNYGPLPFSVANAAEAYLTVGAVTTSGRFVHGSARVTERSDETRVLAADLAFVPARFGPRFTTGTTARLPLQLATATDPANPFGCRPWPVHALAGQMLVVPRGLCTFSTKISNAEQAGANAVLVYNHEAGGDTLLAMAGDGTDTFIRIPSLFMGHRTGLMLTQILQNHAGNAQILISAKALQMGNQPLVVPAFSGRGPTVYGTLKPDLVAPGVHIMSQGYSQDSLDIRRHIGYGQQSGTSMAAPFAAGAAALLKSQHPTWTNEMIQSALMSTAQYQGIYNPDGSAAQPTDMGAGLIDLARAASPGVFLSPPRVDFGRVRNITPVLTQQIEFFNPGDRELVYDVTAEGRSATGMFPLPGIAVTPRQLAIPAQGSSRLTVTLQPAQIPEIPSMLQGYLILHRPGEELHAPIFAWLDILPAATEILLLDADLSPQYRDYAPWYRQALDEMGLAYTYWDAARQTVQVPPLLRSQTPPRIVILFTGDHNRPLPDQPMPVPFSVPDLQLLQEFVQRGGTLLVMGQDAERLLLQSGLRTQLLGQAEISRRANARLANPALQVAATAQAPAGLQDIALDLGRYRTALGTVDLFSGNEIAALVPEREPLAGVATYAWASVQNTLQYHIWFQAPDTLWLEEAWFYIQAEDGTRRRVHDILEVRHRLPVNGAFHWQGQLVLAPDVQEARLAGTLKLALRLGGPLQHTLVSTVPDQSLAGDNAANSVLPLHGIVLATHDISLIPLLGTDTSDPATTWVAGIARDPALATPQPDVSGRTVFTTFGLEHVNNGATTTPRAEFLERLLQYLAPGILPGTADEE